MHKILAALLAATIALPLYAQEPPAPPSANNLNLPATNLSAPSAANPPVPKALGMGAPMEGFSALADRLLPAVVNISTTQIIKDKGGAGGDAQDLPQFAPGSPFDEFFKDFMEKHKQPLGKPHQRKATSLGSGFIISADGFVVTNNHVVQDADEITVILHDDTNLKATVVGRDPKTDVALLKVTSTKPLPFVSFGDSDKMRIGDWILVIGNPFGLGGTVTQGIISARARDINSGPYDDYIQTDASINRGNSGGPMFNMAGEVIGISTAIFSPSGGSVGIGFAVPSSLARNVVSQLRDGGKIRRGWLGVRIQNVTEDIASSLGLEKAGGALVSSLTKDSPAAKAGVQAGDVIISFDGKDITEMRRLPRVVAEAPINKAVPMVLWRNGKKVTVQVTVGEMKEEEATKAESGEPAEEAAPATKGTIVPEFGLKVAPVSPETRKAFDLAEGAKGLVIIDLDDASPLVDKGVKPGDLIVEAGQKPVTDAKAFAATAKEAGTAKKPLLLLLDHGGDMRFIAAPPMDGKAGKAESKKDEPKKK